MNGLFVLVFIGGFVGAVTREFITLVTPKLADGFPLDIFIANIVASFLLGFATGHHRGKRISDEQILLFGTAGLGGMSTFSSFTYGAVSELSKPEGLLVSVAYLIASLVVGFFAVYIGLRLASAKER